MRLTPRAGRDAVEGVAAWPGERVHLTVKVRAAPEKGKANAALQSLIASVLDVSTSTVSIAAGTTARLKTIHVAADPASLASRLQALGRSS